MPGKWISTRTEDMTTAVLWTEKKLSQDKKSGSDRSITLEEFSRDFFSDSDPQGFRHRQKMRGEEYDETYYLKKDGHLRNYILPAHGKFLLSAISDVMIEDFILDITSYTGSGKSLCNDTKNKILMTYSDIMREAKRQGYITENPCSSVDPLVENNEETVPFTEEELSLMFPDDMKKLKWIWGTYQWALYFAIQKDTGWRPGEVAGLSYENWYPELNGIVSTCSVDFRTRKIKESIKTSKKGQKFKEGFLSDQTANLMNDYMHSHPEDKYFFKINGQFIVPNVANKHLIGSSKRAGVDLKGRRQYSFRHSFQTYYIGRMPEMARLLLMGHTRTRQEYSHLSPEQTLQRVISIEGVKEALDNR